MAPKRLTPEQSRIAKAMEEVNRRDEFVRRKAAVLALRDATARQASKADLCNVARALGVEPNPMEEVVTIRRAIAERLELVLGMLMRAN